MVAMAVLGLASLDGRHYTSSQNNSVMEEAIKLLSMAHLLDHANAMVQNHLANHYFWKWTPLAGTVSVEEGSTTVHSTGSIAVEAGEQVRIGGDFVTTVAGDEEDPEQRTSFVMKEAWKTKSASKLFMCACACLYPCF